MLSKIEMGRALFGATVSALAFFSGTAPAIAGDVCELNGTDSLGGASATGTNSLACGSDANAPIQNATAIGTGSSAVPVDSSPFFSSHYLDSALGGTGSTAVGTAATAIGFDSTAIGDHALVGEFVDDPVGGSGFIPVEGGTAVGSRATVEGVFGTALGTSAFASSGVAIGAGSSASVPGLVVTNDYAVAVGTSASANNFGAVAIGSATNGGDDGGAGAYSVAVGGSSIASGGQAIAIGGAESLGDASTVASATNSIAIGSAAKSTHDNSVALGAGTVTTAANQVNVGGRTIADVAAGVAATDAVNVSQLTAVTGDVTAVTTTVTTHTTQIAANTTQISTINSQLVGITADFAELQSGVDTLFDLRGRDRRDMKQGVAAAMSMAQAPMPSGPGRVSYAVNGATFRGEYALGASLNYRLNTQAPMAVSVGASFAGNKNNGFRLGVAGEF
jgi:trimeric autotransporter adhesin